MLTETSDLQNQLTNIFGLTQLIMGPLYAVDEEIIMIAWSQRILEEVTEHLAANVPGFTADSGARLTVATIPFSPA